MSALETWRMSSGLVNLPLDNDYINCGSKAKVHSLCLVVQCKTEKKTYCVSESLRAWLETYVASLGEVKVAGVRLSAFICFSWKKNLTLIDL